MTPEGAPGERRKLGERGGRDDRFAEFLGQTFQANNLVDRTTDDGELYPLGNTDIAVQDPTDVEADLREGHYLMSLRLRLTDPFETRDRVPVSVRVIGKRDVIHDELRGVTLSRDISRRDEFLSRRIRFSTKVKRPCKDRYEGKDPRRSASVADFLGVALNYGGSYKE